MSKSVINYNIVNCVLLVIILIIIIICCMKKEHYTSDFDYSQDRKENPVKGNFGPAYYSANNGDKPLPE